MHQLEGLGALGVLLKLLASRVFPVEGTGLVRVLLVNDLNKSQTLNTEDRIWALNCASTPLASNPYTTKLLSSLISYIKIKY